MDKDVRQLVEMGATPAQARAALRQYKDVMQAAEHIFDGKFDNVMDEDNDAANALSRETVSGAQRMATPEDDEDMGVEDDESDDMDGFGEYDSDEEFQQEPGKPLADADPYAGIFFSKDRREEVIEVEEEPETVRVPEWDEHGRIMTQGEWMKGCPEGSEQSFLFSLYSQLSEGRCPCPHQCGEAILRKKSDFFALPVDFEKYTERLRKNVTHTCKKCRTQYCLACGEPISTAPARDTTTTSDDPLFHCSNLQGVILGVGLFLVEQMYSGQIQEETQLPPPPSSSVDDDDEDYPSTKTMSSKKAKSGTGYAGDVREDMTGQVEAQAVQRARDEKLGHILTAVRWYLPSLRRPGGGRTSDYLVHPTALAHLRRRFNHICSSLLKNDSLSDMSDRSVLYHELFDWLETISHHEALASMMAMPIMVATSVKAVNTRRATNGSRPMRERTIVYEGSSGPRELLESLVIQAQAAMKSLEGMQQAEVESNDMTEEAKRVTNDSKGKAREVELPEDSRKLLGFCKRILATADAIDRFLLETKGAAFVERMRASLPSISPASKETVHVDSGASEEALKDIYVDWATQTRFEYCDLSVPSPNSADEAEADQTPNYKFYYNNEARMLVSSNIPKRSLAIAKELAVLTTNLPVAWDSSIFLRVDETRVDIIKALITGPEGTPYHNGCFLFDVFLGPSYNQSPPSVKYMTTNGGKYRFNPNLYADGKVCLSLLGTWSGPGWVPGKSTLLQVLISIQSMILCDEPYVNEPGWSQEAGSVNSQAYSANVRRMVVKTAMLGNLKAPPEPFGDVVRTHFRLKAKSISEQLDQWLAQDDGRPTVGEGGYHIASKHSGGTSNNGFREDVQEMKQLLAQLQGGLAGSSSSP